MIHQLSTLATWQAGSMRMYLIANSIKGDRVMVDLQPTICNLCGGKVEYISNDKIYGKSYGSGYIYRCTQCGAYVGTNKNKPKEALGILADKEMRGWKMYCHNLFDVLWKGRAEYIKADGTKVKAIKPRMSRSSAYKLLSKELNIQWKDCHFGYFELLMLKKAYAVLKNKITIKREKQ